MNDSRASDITPHQRHLLESFQTDPPDSILVSYKIETLLVIGGFKRGIAWHFFGEPSETAQTAASVPQSRIVEIQNFLARLPVVTRLLPEAVLENDVPPHPFSNRRIFLIAHTSYDLELMSKLWANLNGYPVDHELHGVMSGFPLSAITAFNRHRSQLLHPYDLPAEKWDEPGAAFSGFMFSKSNWEAELMTPTLWAEYCRANAPLLYKEFYDQRLKGYRTHIRKRQAEADV